MKVLIISTSMRGGSNSELLARECEKGAIAAGHEVELVSLRGKEIKYCIGCLSCLETQRCVLNDDVAEIRDKVREAEAVIFATPIYYFEMAGQMKTLLDRMNPLYTSVYNFRKIYMLATAAEEGNYVFEKAYNGLQGWVDCFQEAELCGLCAVGGVGDPKVVENYDDCLKKAYDFGVNIG